ncbi:MAG TPA: S8 family serine peptidase [Rudaea sp.]|nr:S8 family serine peptidase [Rudaea sp.]
MSSLRTDRTVARELRVALLVPGLAMALSCGQAEAAAVDHRVLETAAREGSVDALLVLADQSRPTLAPLLQNGDYRVRRGELVVALQARAATSQRALHVWLDARGIVHRDYWIANLIQARLPASALTELAARGDILRIDPNPHIALRLPPQPASPAQTGAETATIIPWGITKVEAPLVWAAGTTGQGVVIGGEDTGFQWDHPVLKLQYRGWSGALVDHNFNWHDAVHDAVEEPTCGNDSPVPCDPFGHGTHTAGTFVGDDGSAASPRHRTGVAPGARWIGCRNMDKAGTGTPARYIECMQWMLAPTDLNDGNANPDLAPDIVTNSWNCPVDEGCVSGDEIEIAVENLVAAGIFYVAAAGNDGKNGCDTIFSPPATYDATFDAGATDSSDALADFSSRGRAMDHQVPPQVLSTKIRPDISAPGVNVYSAWPPSTYQYLMGTSMAAPHVAGSAALLMSAFPSLRGNPERVAALLRATAVTQGITNTSGVTESCGGTPITQWPNYMVGYGRLDVWKAYHEVVFIDGFDN